MVTIDVRKIVVYATNYKYSGAVFTIGAKNG
jgi:hypothetical protein